MLLLFEGAGKPVHIRLTDDNNIYLATENTNYKFVDIFDLAQFYGNDREKIQKHIKDCNQMKDFLGTLKNDTDREAYVVKEMNKLGFKYRERTD